MKPGEASQLEMIEGVPVLEACMIKCEKDLDCESFVHEKKHNTLLPVQYRSRHHVFDQRTESSQQTSGSMYTHHQTR